MNKTSQAFTLIEVLVSVLVLSLALGSYLGLLRYGQRISQRVAGQSTGTWTALTALRDPNPLRNAHDPDSFTTNAGTTRGYLNGFWVERVVTTDGADALTGQTMQTVTVTVSDGTGIVTSLRERQTRRTP